MPSPTMPTERLELLAALKIEASFPANGGLV
jgi:hypothetical protein